MSKLLVHRAALANIVRRIALAAGEIILDHAEAGAAAVMTKQDGSPVTPVDKDAEDYITRELLALLPDVPVIGEESVAAGQIPDVAGREYVWIVDALDGTRSFIAGDDDYTVNIALIKNGEPVLGVVYAPALGELYAGSIEEDGSCRAIRWHADNPGHEKDLRVRRVPRGGMTVVISRHYRMDGQMENLLSAFKVEKVLKRGSSLKLCLIAAGKADLYPRFGATCLWDIAAGHAILKAAGGQIRAMDGGQLLYAPRERGFDNPPFIAMGEAIPELT